MQGWARPAPPPLWPAQPQPGIGLTYRNIVLHVLQVWSQYCWPLLLLTVRLVPVWGQLSCALQPTSPAGPCLGRGRQQNRIPRLAASHRHNNNLVCDCWAPGPDLGFRFPPRGQQRRSAADRWKFGRRGGSHGTHRGYIHSVTGYNTPAVNNVIHFLTYVGSQLECLLLYSTRARDAAMQQQVPHVNWPV